MNPTLEDGRFIAMYFEMEFGVQFRGIYMMYYDDNDFHDGDTLEFLVRRWM